MSKKAFFLTIIGIIAILLDIQNLSYAESAQRYGLNGEINNIAHSTSAIMQPITNPGGTGLSILSGTVGGVATIGEAFELARLANTSCIHYHVKGICIKWHHGHPKIGIKIEMWKPVLLVETVKKPFDTTLPLIKEIGNIIAKRVGKVASSGSILANSQRALQFNDVHIMSFPFSFFLSIIGNIVPMWCPGLEAPFPTLYYMSELDFVNWRQMADMFTLKRLEGTALQSFGICGLINLANTGAGLLAKESRTLVHTIPHIHLGNMCVGYWGVLYPRLGWNPNESEVVGSAMDAFRAVSWDEITRFGSRGVHQPKVRFLPVPFVPSLNDELQMAKPHKTGCFKIGANPKKWDKNMVSKNGRYLWIYWKHFECCKF